MSDEKLKLRNEEEMESRRKCYKEITSILRELNVKYFIQGGTLLGAYREKDFIKWDWDVEISLFSEEFLLNYEKIRNKLLSHNFHIFKQNNRIDTIKIDFYKEFPYEITGYTLFGWNFDSKKKKYFRNRINIPENFISNMSKINFLDEYVSCPSPIETYLEYQYGNWKKPLRTIDKNEYMTNEFYLKDTLTQKLKINIKNLLRKLLRY